MVQLYILDLKSQIVFCVIIRTSTETALGTLTPLLQAWFQGTITFESIVDICPEGMPVVYPDPPPEYHHIFDHITMENTLNIGYIRMYEKRKYEFKGAA
jgi:hypothetical protein